jgi:hypothetical protein
LKDGLSRSLHFNEPNQEATYLTRLTKKIEFMDLLRRMVNSLFHETRGGIDFKPEQVLLVFVKVLKIFTSGISLFYPRC